MSCSEGWSECHVMRGGVECRVVRGGVSVM